MPQSAITFDVSGDTRRLEQDIAAAVRRVPEITIPVRIQSAPLGRITGEVSEFAKSMEAANARLAAFGAGAIVIGTVAESLRSLIDNAIKVNKAFTDINSVIHLTQSQLQSFGNDLFNVAKNTGQSFQTVTEVATNFARQTQNVGDIIRRTNDALILYRLTGLDVGQSLQALTTIVNTFGSQVGNSTNALNKLIAVDQGFAVRASDLAEAFIRAGTAAKDAGVNVDQFGALVTATQAITQRGGTVIGNALKSIFTRLDRSTTLDDLEKLGIATRDVEGHTLGAIQILEELAKRYDTLSDSQKSYTSQLVGGVYNINVLKAALGDLSNQYGIYNRALSASQNPNNNAAIDRNAFQNRSYSSLINSTQANFVQATSQVGNLTVAPAIQRVLGGASDISSALGNISAPTGNLSSLGTQLGQGILKGIGDYISGPGLTLAGALGIKFFTRFASFSAGAFKTTLNFGGFGEDEKKVQQGIIDLLQRNKGLYDEIIQDGATREQQEKTILGVIQQQIQAREELLAVSQSLGTVAFGEGVRYSDRAGFKNSAGGFVPNFLASKEQSLANSHGYSAGNVIPYQLSGQDSGMSPRQFIQQEGINKAGGFVPNAIVNTAEYKLTRAGSNAVGIIPPNDAQNIDPTKAALKGYNLSKISGDGFVPNFADGNDPTALLSALGVFGGLTAATIFGSLFNRGGKGGSLDKGFSSSGEFYEKQVLEDLVGPTAIQRRTKRGLSQMARSHGVLDKSENNLTKVQIANRINTGILQQYPNVYHGLVKKGWVGNDDLSDSVQGNFDILQGLGIRGAGFVPNFALNSDLKGVEFIAKLKNALLIRNPEKQSQILGHLYKQYGRLIKNPEVASKLDNNVTNALAKFFPETSQSPFNASLANSLKGKSLSYLLPDEPETRALGRFESIFSKNVIKAPLTRYSDPSNTDSNLDFTGSGRNLPGFRANDPYSIGNSKFSEAKLAGLGNVVSVGRLAKNFESGLSNQEKTQKLISIADRLFPQGWYAKPEDSRPFQYFEGHVAEADKAGFQSQGIYPDYAIKNHNGNLWIPEEGYYFQSKFDVDSQPTKLAKQQARYAGDTERGRYDKYEDNFTSPEYRVHIIGSGEDGASKVVPFATFRKDENHKIGYNEIPYVRETDEIRKIHAAALARINQLPSRERDNVVFAPDVIKLKDGSYGVIELNPSVDKTGNPYAVAGTSGALTNNSFVQDAISGFVRGTKPLLARIGDRNPNFAKLFGYGAGFVPNFADPLNAAFSREASFGKTPILGSAPELGIPVGVYNTEQQGKYGSLSNTIRADHLSRGESLGSLPLTGSGKESYVPNFADNPQGGLFDLDRVLKELTASIQSANAAMTETERVEQARFNRARAQDESESIGIRNQYPGSEPLYQGGYAPYSANNPYINKNELDNSKKSSFNYTGIGSLSDVAPKFPRFSEGTSQKLFGASFVAPLLGGVAGQFLNSNGGNPQGERIAQGVGSAAGTALTFAALGGPYGAAIGAVIGGLQVLSTAIENSTPSFEDLSKKAEEYKDKQDQQINSIQGLIQAQAQLKSAINSGNSQDIDAARKNFTQARLSPNLSPDLLKQIDAAQTPGDQQKLIAGLTENSGNAYNLQQGIAGLRGLLDNSDIHGLQSVFSNGQISATEKTQIQSIAQSLISSGEVTPFKKGGLITKDDLEYNSNSDIAKNFDFRSRLSDEEKSSIINTLNKVYRDQQNAIKTGDAFTPIASIGDQRSNFLLAANQGIAANQFRINKTVGVNTNALDYASQLLENRKDITNQQDYLQANQNIQSGRLKNDLGQQNSSVLSSLAQNIAQRLAGNTQDTGGPSDIATQKQILDIINQSGAGKLSGNDIIEKLSDSIKSIQNGSIQQELKQELQKQQLSLADIGQKFDIANTALANSLKVQQDALNLDNTKKSFGGIGTLGNAQALSALINPITQGTQVNIQAGIAAGSLNTAGRRSQFAPGASGDLQFQESEQSRLGRVGASRFNAYQNFTKIFPEAANDNDARNKLLYPDGQNTAGGVRANDITGYIKGIIGQLGTLGGRNGQVLSRLQNQSAYSLQHGGDISGTIAEIQKISQDPAFRGNDIQSEFKGVLDTLGQSNKFIHPDTVNGISVGQVYRTLAQNRTGPASLSIGDSLSHYGASIDRNAYNKAFSGKNIIEDYFHTRRGGSDPLDSFIKRDAYNKVFDPETQKRIDGWRKTRSSLTDPKLIHQADLAIQDIENGPLTLSQPLANIAKTTSPIIPNPLGIRSQGNTQADIAAGNAPVSQQIKDITNSLQNISTQDLNIKATTVTLSGDLSQKLVGAYDLTQLGQTQTKAEHDLTVATARDQGNAGAIAKDQQQYIDTFTAALTPALVAALKEASASDANGKPIQVDIGLNSKVSITSGLAKSIGNADNLQKLQQQLDKVIQEAIHRYVKNTSLNVVPDRSNSGSDTSDTGTSLNGSGS